MSLSVRATRDLAVYYTNALARDLAAASKAQVELDRLLNVPDEWDAADFESFHATYTVILDLTARYRSGESIITIRPTQKVSAT